MSEKRDENIRRLTRYSRNKADYHAALRSNGLELGDLIGGGSYGKVRLCFVTQSVVGRRMWPSGETRLACKIIDKKRVATNFLDKFLPRELQILSEVKHPNIVEFHRTILIEDRVFIVMEFIPGGDLLRYIRAKRTVDEKTSKLIFAQLLSAIEYLHSNNIVHRDIKCENVLIDQTETRIKLIDFGFARYTCNDDGEDVDSTTYCGSAAYAAPEILEGIPYKMRAYDMWSSGVVLYTMLIGSMPFGEKNAHKILQVQRDALDQKMNVVTLSKNVHLKQLLYGLFERNPQLRWDVEQTKKCRWLK